MAAQELGLNWATLLKKEEVYVADDWVLQEIWTALKWRSIDREK
jgi:hypothetical protein